MIAGRRIRLLRQGAGPPLVLVHGIGASADWWLPNLPALAGHFTVYAMDLPGSGESDGLTAEDLEHPEVFLNEFFIALDLRKSALIGHSLGGYVAARLTLANPERVSRLVLVDSAGFGDVHHGLLRALALPVIGEVLMRGPECATEFFVRSLVIQKGSVPRSLVQRAHRFLGRHGSAHSFLRMLRSGITPSGRWKRPVLAPSLRESPVPLLVLWGADDPVFPVAQAGMIRTEVPAATVRTLPNCGHVPQLEFVQRFADLVLPFLLAGTAVE